MLGYLRVASQVANNSGGRMGQPPHGAAFADDSQALERAAVSMEGVPYDTLAFIGRHRRFSNPTSINRTQSSITCRAFRNLLLRDCSFYLSCIWRTSSFGVPLLANKRHMPIHTTSIPGMGVFPQLGNETSGKETT